MTGKYTIAEVEQRTGVPASSLRQWERRYDFPKPQRSPSGYRYYSEGDLAKIEKMRGLVSEGVPPSRAAALMLEAAETAPTARPARQLSQELGDSLRALDVDSAELRLSEAFALHPIEDVLLDVIRPAMVRVGDLWQAGSLSVTTEHYASNYIQGRLRTLLATTPPAPHGQRVLIACAPGEHHEIGPLILAILLKRAAFDVVYLGADTPIDALVDMTRTVRPVAVLLSATEHGAAERLRADRRSLRSMAPLLLLGGQAFEGDAQLAAELGGTFLGNDVRTVIPALGAHLAKGSTRA